ncbi:MAG: hypothetical protein N2312_03740, partial [Dictyoglomaceae bacterium]|nr:hypothetical protein [Dictyoglomaceae bacterium]
TLGLLFFISKIVVSFLIIIFINILFGLPYSVLIPPRIISLLIEVPAYTVVTLPLLNRLEKEVI